MPLRCGKFQNVFYKNSLGTSLMVQWLRIHLAMQRTQVQSLMGNLTSYMPWSNQAHTPQLESMRCKVKSRRYTISDLGVHIVRQLIPAVGLKKTNLDPNTQIG